MSSLFNTNKEYENKRPSIGRRAYTISVPLFSSTILIYP